MNDRDKETEGHSETYDPLSANRVKELSIKRMTEGATRYLPTIPGIQMIVTVGVDSEAMIAAYQAIEGMKGID